MATSVEELNKYAAFAANLASLREIFPEHAREIDRCLFDVGQKLDRCFDPNCNCKFNFETFHGEMNSQKRFSNGK